MGFKMRGHTLPGFKQKDVLTASNVNNIKIKSQSDDAARAEMSRLDGEISNATTPAAKDSLGNLHTAASLGLSSSFINNPNSRKSVPKPSGLQQGTADNAGKGDADDGTNYLRPGPSLGELEELEFKAHTSGDTAKAAYFGRQFADLKAQLVKDGKMDTKDKGKISPKLGGGYDADPNVKGGY